MTQPTVDKARAALDDFLSQYRQEKRKQLVNDLVSAVLNEAADELKTACPDHGSSTTCFMRCQCDAADALRRMAREART
jgi:hypothetical protein